MESYAGVQEMSYKMTITKINESKEPETSATAIYQADITTDLLCTTTIYRENGKTRIWTQRSEKTRVMSWLVLERYYTLPQDVHSPHEMLHCFVAKFVVDLFHENNLSSHLTMYCTYTIAYIKHLYQAHLGCILMLWALGTLEQCTIALCAYKSVASLIGVI